jgi:hypothetical protein
MRCIIVGDGPSAQGFVPPAGVTVFAVKRTIHWLSRADYWFTLDPNADSVRIMLKQKPGVKYVCACDDVTRIPAGVTKMRRKVSREQEPAEQGGPHWWAWRWGAVFGLSDTPGTIHTGNSAYGALGLAYLLGYRAALLVGVDGTQDARQSDGKEPNNLSHLPLLFQSAKNQVDIATLGTMDGIPSTTLADWLAATSTH